MEKYGLLGEKLGHSFSPRIHAELADYEYRLYEKSPGELEEFLKNGDFDGLNVTIPYKLAVIPYCRELSPKAVKIGSVNTLVRRADGSLFGDNTDYDGFTYMLRRLGAKVGGRKVLVFGDGGAARTVRTVLKDYGAGEIVTISRRGENNYNNLERHSDAELIVNTTPLGMYPRVDAAAVDLSRFPNWTAVLDLIYNPFRTKLLLQAGALGMKCSNGMPMLVKQAVRACEIFTDAPIDEDRSESLIEKVTGETMNVALIGMPGCGKSTVGKELSVLLNRRFVDMDEEIESEAGRKIPEIFAESGEKEFRRIETSILAKLAGESGLVIATGGGIVTRDENLPLLKMNSRIVYLERDIGTLPDDGRPLSQKYGTAQLAEKRLPLYEAWSDVKVPVTTARETAERTIKALKNKKIV